LAAAFASENYEIAAARSDWLLPQGAPLARACAEGIAAAACEAGLDAAVAQDWARARQNAGARIGHVDILARPKIRSSAG
jgi:hypothetical protein